MQHLWSSKGAHKPGTSRGPWFYTLLDKPWVAGMRLEVIDGQLCVAELHVFAADFDQKDWVAELDSKPDLRSEPYLRQAVSRQGALPQGGIGARLLRKIHISEHLMVDKSQRRFFAQKLGGVPTFRAIVLTPQQKTELVAQAERKPGRKGHPPVFYARLAARYEQEILAHSRKPIVVLAEEMHLSTSRVRDLVHEARNKGFLTKAGRGRSGGALTEEGRKVLSQEKRRRKK